MAPIGEKIKSYRLLKNMTQKKLSELTGIHEVTIRQYEANKYSPKMINLEKIATALDVSPSDLIGITEDSNLYQILKLVPSASFDTDNKRVKLFNANELHNYFLLNEKGRQKALSYIEDLVKLPEYTEDMPSETTE
ncbi:helix-turn-helix domain-containing protein [Enterocloster lavalensis]|uniref:helix-turn-helix domain-containing protein n=1 Tax=Enterocloster lavalensis TaxID=460384 RepID=UPI001D0603D6|nr:helix-turn-helix transcriptional regulator [Enterocloster lavalensis]MCB6343643.1 helix-turn-helix transcriptional regulator [Enterocloster lavalensis]